MTYKDESLNGVLIRVRHERSEGALDWTEVERLMGVVIETEGKAVGLSQGEESYRWQFSDRPALVEGVRFSTDSNADMMWSADWFDRLDGGIQDGGLFFFGYKKLSPSDGRVLFLDDKHWFDGDAWEPYR